MRDIGFQVERKRLADQIADRIVGMIAAGTFKPGDRLPSEPALMKQFNVGRSSIREAIGALSLVGLLTVRPGHGTHVAALTNDNNIKSSGLLTLDRERVRELVEARIELESIIVRLAAERATKQDRTEIREKHMLLHKSSTRGKRPIVADLAFHMAIADACHNSVLTRFFSEMTPPVRNWMEQKSQFDWGYEKVYEQHERIFVAIKAGDAQKAEEAMRVHLMSTGEKLVAAILGSATQ